MKNLKTLREELSNIASELGPIDVHIPDELKLEMQLQWDKCKALEPGLVILHTDKGKKEDQLSDLDVLKSVFAHELTSELLEYRRKLGIYLAAANVHSKELKQLNSKASQENPPTWWPNVTTQMAEDENLSDTEQKQLISFALDKNWSGCTKGVGRGDFYVPSVVNALHGAVTYNSMLAIAAKELLELEVADKIRNWYTHDAKANDNHAVKLNDAFIQICGFCSSYNESKSPIKSNDPECQEAIAALKELQGYLKDQFKSYKGIAFDVRHSKGAGNFPRVPWIVILPPEQSPNEGVYFSMCFGREGNGAVAGFSSSVANLDLLETVERSSKDLVINVNGGDPKQHYNDTFVNPLEIYKAEGLSLSLFTSHVAASLDRAIDFLQLQTSPSKTPLFHLSGNLDSRSTELALLTKPFTILTGASGTGKTKLAESLAGHYRNDDDIKKASNLAIVPVGADWTDNRNVLGFVNHLREDNDSRPIYQSTPILNLILDARANQGTPHFLILDEMNLSHVERYFADFLSAMEQSNGVLPLHSEGSEGADPCRLPRFEGDSIGVPRDISYPDNLYVIGTVNVDETTYMFSPKVLDRANVIEFKVAKGELDEFLDEAGNYPEVVRANEGQAEAFHKLAMESRDGKLDDLPAPVHAGIKTHLLALFDIMQEGRFEFAYRTAKEVMRYMAVCRHLADDKHAWDGKGWKSDLDDQILQKILPKLHGSMGRVGKLLASLAAYCHNGGLTGEAPNLNASIQLEGEGEFPKSFSKLKSMMETLKEEQFVSFIQ